MPRPTSTPTITTIGIGLLGIATLPTERGALITGLTRAGVVLFLVAPVLCVTAVFADYWM
jgi:hypothetical protein